MSTFITIDTVYRDRGQDPNPCNFTLTVEQISNWFKYAREVRAYPQNSNKRPLEFVTSANVHSVTLPYPRISLYSNESITVIGIDAAGTTLTSSTALPAWFVVGAPVQVGVNSNGLLMYKTYYINSVASPNFTLDVIDPPAAAVTFIPGSGLNIPVYNYTIAVEATLTDALSILGYPRLYLNYHQGYNDRQLVNSISSIHDEVKFVLVYDHVQYDSYGTPVWIHYRSVMDQVMRLRRDFPPSFTVTSRNGDIIPFFIDYDQNLPANPDKQMLLDLVLTPYIRDAMYTNGTIETANI